jgi:hypothetical protein
MKLGLVGIIVACETRWTTRVKRAFAVGELSASWILTIDVESADEGGPAAAGARASFLIHSPTHTLRVPAEDAPGRRFRFEIERETIEGGVRWSGFVGYALA